MSATEIVQELEPLALASHKKVLLNHGATEPILGVKISELQKIRKRIKKDYQLALDLYATSIYDAQYLAGLIADETKMTTSDLRRWLATSNCSAIAACTVAWVAAESPHGRELALDWIESTDETTAQAGWMTLCSLVAVRDDAQLDLPELARLLQRVEQTIHHQPNHVRYAMNSYVIALGSYVRDLTDQAIASASRIGPVTVDMGNTACAVPSALDYIEKVRSRGAVGKKRKTVRC
jgi:3-methyladenine DNA glycosylase AlkD